MPDKYGSGGVKASAIVVGGGPAGLTAAIALAGGGIETVLVGKRPGRADNRTTALLAGSVTALETLGVWAQCADRAAPLKVMRIVDDTGRLWRAPEVKFAADESGCTPGEILCVATHADAQLGLGKAKVGAMLETARSEGVLA